MLHDGLYSHYVAVTPHDSTNFADGQADALFVSVPGTVTLVRADATAVQVTVTVASIVLPMRCIRVNLTGTAATGIVALYRAKGRK